MFPALSRIFIPERHRQRAAPVGFSVPAMSEVFLESEAQPLLASNMRNGFVLTRLSRDGVGRMGFSECPVADEDDLLVALVAALRATILRECWSNKTSSIEDGMSLLPKLGYEPRAVVVAPETEIKLSGVEVMACKGLGKTSLVLASPQHTGFYARVGDYVGILAQKVNRAFVVVE